MKGVIERIYLNSISGGREYLTMQISGTKYSVWDKKYFRMFNEGMPVDFKFNKSGKYLNISEIEEDPDYKPENDGNNNPFNYPNHRDLQILKTSCLKCATSLVRDISVGLEKKLDLTLDVAKRLEKYLSIFPTEGEDSLAEESPNIAELDKEF